jgi:membrane protease YdiL (CAAX protease family)
VGWRVAPVWYLVALAGWPAPTVAALLAWPGAAAALTAPAAGFAATYAGTFLLILVFGGPLGEEPGWRGFALPLLQQRVGPLAGALVVGALHALWHLPIHLLVPSHRGLPGFVLLVAGVIALSVVSCWIFNNTRGSLLIAMLHHATTNSAVVVLVATFPAFAIMPALDVVRPLLHAGVALLLVAATRGRLCYERYRRETGEIRQR